VCVRVLCVLCLCACEQSDSITNLIYLLYIIRSSPPTALRPPSSSPRSWERCCWASRRCTSPFGPILDSTVISILSGALCLWRCAHRPLLRDLGHARVNLVCVFVCVSVCCVCACVSNQIVLHPNRNYIPLGALYLRRGAHRPPLRDLGHAPTGRVGATLRGRRAQAPRRARRGGGAGARRPVRHAD